MLMYLLSQKLLIFIFETAYGTKKKFDSDHMIDICGELDQPIPAVTLFHGFYAFTTRIQSVCQNKANSRSSYSLIASKNFEDLSISVVLSIHLSSIFKLI